MILCSSATAGSICGWFAAFGFCCDLQVLVVLVVLVVLLVLRVLLALTLVVSTASTSSSSSSSSSSTSSTSSSSSSRSSTSSSSSSSSSRSSSSSSSRSSSSSNSSSSSSTSTSTSRPLFASPRPRGVYYWHPIYNWDLVGPVGCTLSGSVWRSLFKQKVVRDWSDFHLDNFRIFEFWKGENGPKNSEIATVLA